MQFLYALMQIARIFGLQIPSGQPPKIGLLAPEGHRGVEDSRRSPVMSQTQPVFTVSAKAPIKNRSHFCSDAAISN